jgi:hypothetical protein
MRMGSEFCQALSLVPCLKLLKTIHFTTTTTNNNNNLTIEIKRMWNVKTRMIPVITAAAGTISKSFRKYVSTIPGNHEVKELQKTANLAQHTYLEKC